MREYRTIDDYLWFIKGSSIIDRTDYAFCVFQGDAFSNHSGCCMVRDDFNRAGKYIKVHNNFYIVTEEPRYYK